MMLGLENSLQDGDQEEAIRMLRDLLLCRYSPSTGGEQLLKLIESPSMA